MEYSEKEFYKKDFLIKDKKIPYYLSPILGNYGFIHAFFTKNSSDIKPKYISNHFQKNHKNCFNKQIHSNKIIFGSETNIFNLASADGIVSDKANQSLWIYTADCMPILIADFRNKIVASLHCGRKGLENKIIQKLIKLLKKIGCNKSDIIVAIGPTISSKKYILDKDLFNQLNKKLNSKNFFFEQFQHKNFYRLNCDNKIELDLRKCAYFQLLKEDIYSKNIDISNKCTYIESKEFHSYRKTKTEQRQWSFISN